MALETSPESPAPLRQISMLIGQWVERMGAVWIEAEVTELKRLAFESDDGHGTVRPLLQQAMDRIARGQSSLEELFRVVGQV